MTHSEVIKRAASVRERLPRSRVAHARGSYSSTYRFGVASAVAVLMRRGVVASRTRFSIGAG